MAAPCPAASLPPNSAAICRCSPERRRASLSRSGRLRISSRICHPEPLILEPAVRACRSLKGVDVCVFLTSARSSATGVLPPKASLYRPRPLSSSALRSPHLDRIIAALDLSPDLPKLTDFRVSAAAPISTVSNQRQERTSCRHLAILRDESCNSYHFPLSLEAQGDDVRALVVACSSFNHWSATGQPWVRTWRFPTFFSCEASLPITGLYNSMQRLIL